MTIFFDDRGLVNSSLGEKHAENSPLWTMELLLLRYGNGEDITELKMVLYSFYQRCKIRDGLYHQRPDNNHSKEDSMSHDQLTAMFCFFYFFGYKNEYTAIWNEIKRQKGHYDNVNPDKPNNFLHPRDFLFYGLLAGFHFPFSIIAMALFKIITWESCHSKWKVRPAIQDRIKYFFKHLRFMPEREIRRMPVTDGKLLTFVRCYSTMEKDKRFKKVWNMATRAIKKNPNFGSWRLVFFTYFGNGGHPIREQAKKHFQEVLR